MDKNGKISAKQYSATFYAAGQGGICAAVRGRIDNSNYELFMADMLAVECESSFIIDAAELVYISSAGLRVLIALAKKYKERFSIINANSSVMEILTTTGISNIISVNAHADGVEVPDLQTNAERAGFCKQLKKYADNTMVIWKGDSYTYRDVDIISQIIASDLYAMGVRRYSHVAIICADSINSICAFLAIAKLGAVAVMLNPALTGDEIKKLSVQGDISFVCCEGQLESESENENIYCIGEDVDFREKMCQYPFDCEHVEAEQQPQPWTVESDPDTPCVMIFTSGSTGTPKGALHSFYSMQYGIAELIKETEMNASDIICHTLPYFHIGGLCLEVISAMLTGASICFPHFSGGDIVKRMECILTTIEKYKCTIMGGISTTFLSIAGLEAFTKEKVKSLRCCFFGAQPVTVPQMEQLLMKYSNKKLINLYGMTEIFPAIYVTSNDTREHLFETVGKAIRGVEVDIRSYSETAYAPSENTTPSNNVGEVFIKGGQSMVCYYKMEIEKQSLSSDGFVGSGDLGYMDEDGYLHLVGRIKDIIIRGGENIVPREVEEAIACRDDVQLVYVCGVPDELMGEKVAAAVVMKKGFEFNANEIKKYLVGKIAKHKIPSYIISMDAFPLLPNGKNDKVTLKKIIVEKSKNKQKQTNT